MLKRAIFAILTCLCSHLQNIINHDNSLGYQYKRLVCFGGFAYICVCACVCVCVRACLCLCVCLQISITEVMPSVTRHVNWVNQKKRKIKA